MINLRAVKTGCRYTVPVCGRDKVAAEISGMQTCTAATSQTEFLFPAPCGNRNCLRNGIICSSSYDGSFSVFFYACASQSYDAFFSYHKAYSNIFLNLFVIICSKRMRQQRLSLPQAKNSFYSIPKFSFQFPSWHQFFECSEGFPCTSRLHSLCLLSVHTCLRASI